MQKLLKHSKRDNPNILIFFIYSLIFNFRFSFPRDSAGFRTTSTQLTSFNIMKEFIPIVNRRVTFFFGIIFLLFSFFLNGWTATYYVDATNGNDNNFGLSTTTAWKTIAKVNQSNFLPGDNILFKRGEFWREQLTVPSSGSSINPISFGAYESGADPIISGMRELAGWSDRGNWTNQGSNIWLMDRGIYEYTRLVIDGKEYIEAETFNDVDDNHRWFYDTEYRDLYLYATENPATAYLNMYYAADVNGILVDGKSYIEIQNIEIQGGYYGIKIRNACSNILVHDCTIGKYTYSQGIRIQGVTSSPYTPIKKVEIYNNTIDFDYDNSADDYKTKGTAEDCVFLGSSVESCKIYENIINACTHSCVMLISNDSNCPNQHNEVYKNKIDGTGSNYCRGIDITNGGHGAVDGQTAYNLIYRNIISNTTVRNQIFGDHNEFYYNIIYNVTEGGVLDNVSDGIGLFGPENQKCHNNKIYNNTIYNVAHNGIIVYGDANCANVQNNLVRNNLVMNWGKDKYGIYIEDHTTVLDNTYEHNLLYKSGVSDVVYHGHDGADDYPHTIEEFNAKNGSVNDVIGGNISSDPLMTDPDNDDFTLQSSSPCINAGADVGLTQDYLGNGLSGSVWDIGASEYQNLIFPKIPINFRILK